jgi:hypothetical protein
LGATGDCEPTTTGIGGSSRFDFDFFVDLLAKQQQLHQQQHKRRATRTTTTPSTNREMVVVFTGTKNWHSKSLHTWPKAQAEQASVALVTTD